MQDGEGQKPGEVIEPGETKATPQEEAGWQFKPEIDETAAPTTSADRRDEATVSWTASEFIAHEKPTSWYTLLGLGGITAAALTYLLTKDWIAATMMLIVAVIFGVFAARKPRVLNYSLDQVGLQIGNKLYPYADFKSFSIMDEGGVSGIWLMPLKRFMPSITIYYAPDDEDKIVKVLANYLPLEDRDHDMVDRLMRKVRF